MQGLGLYTMEELNYSPVGLLYTRGPSQYKIPAVGDVPLQFNVYLLPDSHNPHAIYSSKVGTQTRKTTLKRLSLPKTIFTHILIWLRRVSENPSSSWAVPCSSPSKTPWLRLAQIPV